MVAPTRREQVASLRESGLSLRAIASATGASKDTVSRVLSGVASETPASVITVDRETGETGEIVAESRKVVGTLEGPATRGMDAGPATTTLGDIGCRVKMPHHCHTDLTGTRQEHRTAPTPRGCRGRRRAI